MRNDIVYGIIAVVSVAFLLFRFYHWAWTRGWRKRDDIAERMEETLLRVNTHHLGELVRLKHQLYKLEKAVGTVNPDDFKS